MKVRVCVPITVTKDKKDVATLAVKAAGMHPSLIEFRLDYLKNGRGLKRISKLTTLPKIATARRLDEGGNYRGTETARIKLLLEAVESGFEYIDIELSTLNVAEHVRSIKEKGIKVIVSKHIMQNTPPLRTLKEILEKQVEVGADICKIIPRAKGWDDNLTVLNFLSNMRERTYLICFAMGKYGYPSRILSPIFGGFCTYASVKRGSETAEGQLLLKDLRTIYKTMGIELV